MIKGIEELIGKMENILEKDDFEYEDDGRLQELFYQIKDMLAEAYEYEFEDKKLRELEVLENRFNNLNKEWETPEERRQATLNTMFPDEDSMEGFDVDDFFGLD